MKGQFERRAKLWVKWGGRCHWCGRETKLVTGVAPACRVVDMATIDHLYPKGTGVKRSGDRFRCVLACFECNQRRNKEFIEGSWEALR